MKYKDIFFINLSYDSIIGPTKFDESWKNRCWSDLLEQR